MNFNYPVSLNLEEKKVVVIGGGSVAQRKVKDLLKTKCQLEVYAETIDPGFMHYLEERKVKFSEKTYEEDDLSEAFMVIAATDNREVNHEISIFCNLNNILVNVVDAREDCNFLVNTVLKRGDLAVSVSTNGKAPALAKRIIRQLDGYYPVEYAIFIELLFEYREMAKEKISDQEKRSDFLRDIANLDVIEDLNQGHIDRVRERMEECASSYME